jgi:hypothetical protein
MKDQNMWIRTQDVPGWEACSLRFKLAGPLNLENRRSPGDSVAGYIRLEGPIIGALRIGPDYVLSEWDEYVYRGVGSNKEGKDFPWHAVVCMGHKYTPDGELHIRILDNLRKQGPKRWILFQAFHSFYLIDVEPLDRAVLKHSDG